jgi:hypothetical protein
LELSQDWRHLRERATKSPQARIAVIPRLRVVLRLIVLGLPLASPSVRAQPRTSSPTPDDTQELRVIESTEQGEDPLGIDRATGAELDEAAKRVSPGATEARPTPSQGAVLSALSQVRETSHQVFIRIEQGLAFVQARMEFESRAKHDAELAYRLALPPSAVVTEISLCPVKGPCLFAIPSAAANEGPRPTFEAWLSGNGPPQERALAVSAEAIEDRGGYALAMRAAPLLAMGKLALAVKYVVEAPMRGGRVHVWLPARGEDPRGAPTSQVHVIAPGFLPLEVPDEYSWEASLPLEVSAQWPASKRVQPLAARVRCGSGICLRRYMAVGKAPHRARPIWLWIDASPSMEGPARGRVDVVLAALLASLPADTSIAAHAFGARAQALGRFNADSAPLSLLSDATLSDLDAATRPAAVLAETADEIAKERPRILILSDGLIDRHPEQRRALAQAHERGAEVWLLVLGQRQPESLGPNVHVLPLAQEADRALKTGALEELGDALSIVLSEEAQPGLRFGEQRVVESKPNKRFMPKAAAPWLAHWINREQPAPHWMASDGTLATPVIAAIPFLGGTQEPALDYSAMPAESVLEMLRTQLVPKARACLRSDRRGRADYSVALSFRAFFSQREVSEVTVEGKIPEHLRNCLTDLLPKLRVPAFSGGVRVRYPIHTDREAPPPVVEMTPEISESVRRVMTTPLRRP